MRRFDLWFFAGMLVVAAGASLAGTSTITVKDSAGATQTYEVRTNGSAQFLSEVVLCDQSAGASCATVSGNALKVDGSAATQPVSGTVTANAGSGTLTVAPAAQTTGGCTMAHTLSAASTNATSVKGSAGTLCSLNVINTTVALYYLKFYDKATAATCNSDTVLQTIAIPFGASNAGGGIAVNLGPFGWAFPTGITFCLTGGIADNDNTAAATGVTISYSYK